MGSEWVSVITAAAALLGVALGQLLQGRRENVRWLRERELDAEHREEQRLRDRESWNREELERFREQKRQVYADYQSLAYRISVLIVDTARELETISRSGEDSHDRIKARLDELDFRREFASKYDELKVVRNHLRLLAPPSVLMWVTAVDEVLIPVPEDMENDDPQAAQAAWGALRSARLGLLDFMRIDLNPSGERISGDMGRSLVSNELAERWRGESDEQ